EEKRVVPVLYKSCQIPYRLRRLHYVDFTREFDTGLTRLLEDLNIQNPSTAVNIEPPQDQIDEGQEQSLDEVPAPESSEPVQEHIRTEDDFKDGVIEDREMSIDLKVEAREEKSESA